MIKAENLGITTFNGEPVQDLYVEIEQALDPLELMAIFSELKAQGYTYSAVNKILKEAYCTDPVDRIEDKGSRDLLN